MTKMCSKCGLELNIDNFCKNCRSKDGLQAWCKNCQKEYDIQRNHNNQKRIEYNKQTTKNTCERRKIDIAFRTKLNEQSRKYNNDNKEKVKIKQKEYRKRNKELIKLKDKERECFQRKFSRMIHSSFKTDNYYHFEDILPYTFEELKQHIESQFDENMNWGNHTLKEGWHIDHIIPQCMLPFDSVEDINFKICWSLYNLRPLWCTDNLSRPKDGSDISSNIKINIISKALNINYDSALSILKHIEEKEVGD